ncbi:sensor histidine kinase [Streptomyces sp. NPDC018019]|uniref:sensor histidine kinase n=1 Tax=Streptomyces sp. NPDC018019 TaxID=3365030 RepID=UPI0037B5DDDF
MVTGAGTRDGGAPDAGAPDGDAARKRRLTWSAAAALCLLLPLPFVRAGLLFDACLAALPAVVAAFAAPMRRPWGRITPATAVLAAAVLSLAVDIGYRGPKDYAALWEFAEAPALLVLAVRQIRRAPARQAAVGGALAVAAFALLPLRFLYADPPAKGSAVVLLGVLALCFALPPAGVALYLRVQEDRRRRAVARARRAQRLEVAGDLHDFVAHEVTGIVLEVQAARVAAYDREQTAELLARLEDAGLRALESMDRTVRTLRDPEGHATAGAGRTADAHRHHRQPPAADEGELPPTRPHGLADLSEMVERFAATGGGHMRRNGRGGDGSGDGSGGSGGAGGTGGTGGSEGGVQVLLDLDDGLTGTLSRATEDAVHRVVLEALTNIRRHAAGAGLVTVAVARVPAGGGPGNGPGVAVTVTDDGGGRPGGPLGLPRHSGGTGLAALTGRVEALGGTLTCGRHASGWRVHAVLPAA